jgi:hypothetical protein
MTLVAAWMTEAGVPALIGDMLVVNEGDTYQKPHVTDFPTTSHLDEILPRDWQVRVSGLAQKVYVIPPNLAVGYSGPVTPAIKTLQAMYGEFCERRPRLEDLKAFLEQYDAKGAFAFSLAGWLMDNGHFTCFKWRSDNPAVVERHPYVCIGTGTDLARRAMTTVTTEGSDPIAEAIRLTGDLTGREVFYGQPLREKFGGTFKVVCWSGTEFSAVRRALYLFLHGTWRDQTGLELGPGPRLLRTCCSDGYFQILACPGDEDGNPVLSLVESALRSASQTAWDPDLDLASDYCSVCVMVTMPNRSIEAHTLAFRCGANSNIVALDGGIVTLDLPTVLLEGIVGRLRASDALRQGRP